MENAIFICVLANTIVSIALLVELRLSRRDRLANLTDATEPDSIDVASATMLSGRSFDQSVQSTEPVDSDEAAHETEEEHAAIDGIDSVAATCSALAEEHGLTNRESEVLIQLARGYNCRSIAELLTISEATVKSHSLKVYRKLGVHSQQELITLVQLR